MYWCHYPVGFLDEMLTIFDDHHHPVVLIGDQALCWMAVRLDTGQVCLPALNRSRLYFNIQLGVGLIGENFPTKRHNTMPPCIWMLDPG
jgi:hypothetical protein